jgi:hypothetical protein
VLHFITLGLYFVSTQGKMYHEVPKTAFVDDASSCVNGKA